MKLRSLITTAALTISTLCAAQPLHPVEPDTAVLIGHLPNGLTYIIRHNELPKNTAEFYIVQKVGAILEDDNQNGLAHFLEHMAFNGTKNFPNKGIINFLERVGVRFGENINAYTSVDETVYNLSAVPTENEAIIDSALLVLHDWSNFISLQDDEIDKERGVIREEWRTRNSASRRLYFGHLKNTMPNTQYAKRDVIGDTAIIANFKYDDLRAFYKKWYRPDLQGIVIVGDVDPKAIEAKITALWQDIPAPTNPAKRTYFDVPLNNEPIVSILTDPEAQRTSFTLSFRSLSAPDSVRNSVEYIPFLLSQMLCAQVFNYRMQDLIQQGASFTSAGMFHSSLTPKLDGTFFSCRPKEGHASQAVSDFLDEVEKLRRYGVNNGELQRASDNLLKAYQNAYDERNKRQNDELVTNLYRCFIDNDVITSIDYDYEMVKLFLPYISIDIINGYIKNIFDKAPVIEVSANSTTEGILSKDEYLEALNLAESKELAAYEDEIIDSRLVDNEPTGGKVNKIKASKIYDAKIVTLSNGISVALKPTTYADNEILLGAFSKGGFSTLPSEYAPSASLMSTVSSQMGLGRFSSSDLRKALTGKTASVATSISLKNESVSGASTKEDFETLLQLVYLTFSPMRKDEPVYDALMSRMQSNLATTLNNPNNIFADSLYRILQNNNPYVPVIIEPKDIEDVSLERVEYVYNSRFSSARDFQFVIVGSFDVDSILPLVAKWIGALPTEKRIAKPVERNTFSPQNDVSSDFSVAMEANKTRSILYLSHKYKYSRQDALTLLFLEQILDMRYLESVREDEGGTYGVSVDASLDRAPSSEYGLSIFFDTDPDAYDRLAPILTKEIETIAQNGPRSDDFDKVSKYLIKARTEALQNNSTWLTLIKNNLLFGDDDSDYEARVKDISPSDVQKWAQRILNEANKVRVTMRPAQKSE